MTRKDEGLLPLGAKGMEFQDNSIEFRPDGKLLIFVKNQPFHFTVHPGGSSGYMDVHKTWHGNNKHETLFSMDSKDFILKLGKIGLEFRELLKRSMRKARFGWLSHRGILLVHAFSLADFDRNPALSLNKRKRLTFDESKINPVVLDFPLAVIEYPNGSMFHMLKNSGNEYRSYGYLFKFQDRFGEPYLRFYRNSDLKSAVQTVVKLAASFTINN